MIRKDLEPIAHILEEEKHRVAERDRKLLSAELTRMKIQLELTDQLPQSLDEYCRWLSPSHPKKVKWDLLRHYSINENLPYQYVYKKNNNQTICKPHNQDYGDRLLTHSLAWEYWEKAEERGFLSCHPDHPMVCFSSGQVVFKGAAIDGMYSMTVIFDRQALDRVYTLLPYSDHEVQWEKEIRAHESINLDLALGCIPTQKFLLDLDHWGQLTSVCGRKIMSDLESNYLKTGALAKVH